MTDRGYWFTDTLGIRVLSCWQMWKVPFESVSSQNGVASVCWVLVMVNVYRSCAQYPTDISRYRTFYMRST